MSENRWMEFADDELIEIWDGLNFAAPWAKPEELSKKLQDEIDVEEKRRRDLILEMREQD